LIGNKFIEIGDGVPECRLVVDVQKPVLEVTIGRSLGELGQGFPSLSDVPREERCGEILLLEVGGDLASCKEGL
jgi:hypothetical protein